MPLATATPGPTVRAGSLLEAQAGVLEMIVRGDPLPDVLAALCRIVEAEAGRPVRSAILLADAAARHLTTGAAPSLPEAYCRAIDGIAISPNVGTCCAAAARKEIVVTADIAGAPGWSGLSHLPLGLGLQAAWSMPIVSSSGGVLGTFGTYFFDKGEPTAEEQRLVAVLARTAALAIERRRNDDALAASARRDRFLAELAAATQPLVEPAEVMATTARLLAEHLEVDRCAYAEIEDERIFVITGDHGRGVPSIVGRWDVSAFGPACARDMLAGNPYVVVDTDAHPEIGPEHLPAYRATNIRAVICVPLHKQGRFTAAMAVHQTRPRAWTPQEIELVGVVVARCWEALERVRVTRELRASLARHQAIVETSPECVKIVAGDGTLLQMNPAGLRMIEAAGEAAAIGRSVYDLVAPEHRQAFRELNQRVCSGEAGTLSFDIIGLRGTRRSMETAAVPLASADGGFTHLAIARDVTARVAADRALAESRARLEYAVRLSGVGFWYCDLPFDELVWDPRVKAHFFLAADARVTIETFYDRIHPDDREPTARAIEASIREHKSYDVVYRTVDPTSGAVNWIRALGGAAYGVDGTPTRFDGVTVDVTEQKLGEEHLTRLYDQLREQDQRKDEFLATLAHELRNPLAPIRTGLHLLGRATTPEQAAKTRGVMERQLHHMVRLVDDLLDLSRVTLGKLTLKKEPIDFRSVLQAALETTSPLIETAGHALDVRLPEQPLPLDADATRMAQVLANLINNAAKYTPRGGHIVVSAAREGAWLVVQVSDDGVGIPRDMVGRVFDMFTQVGTSSERSQGGLGIGLTLVRRLVQLHGGSVTADSDGPGRGSTFTVRLPLGAAVAPSAGGAAPPLVVAGPVSPRRVLVVDDNVDAAEGLAMLLQASGHDIRLAHTGPAALAAALEFRPDVVLLDLGLPGLSGYEVARRLRADGGAGRPLLVAVTGWSSADDRSKAQAAGFDRHLVKPVDPAKLVDLLAVGAGQPAARAS